MFGYCTPVLLHRWGQDVTFIDGWVGAISDESADGVEEFVGWMGWGKVYDCIVFAQDAEYLKEVEDLPVEKILVDSTFGYDDLETALERLNTGRTRDKVVIEVNKP